MKPVYQKLSCSYASKYKGIRKPTCGCKSCNDLWNKKERK